MSGVALVLGAGGIVGGAWMCGALAGLHEATGWDARDADLIVGTSAGATVAATLRQGFSPLDHYNRMAGRPLTEEGARLAGQPAPGVLSLPDPPNFSLTGWRPQSPRLVLAALSRVTDPRPGLTLAGLAPAGQVPHRIVGDQIRARMETPWPERATWICSVRLHDGRRVVLGRDERPSPDLARAVEASVAIPGYFEPVEIEGARYIDGGTHSTTNADLAAGLGFDVVVVLSPMTAVTTALPPTTRRFVRGFHARGLAREVRRIRRCGSQAVVLQPTEADLAVLGSALDAQLAPGAAEAGRASVARHLSGRSLPAALTSDR